MRRLAGRIAVAAHSGQAVLIGKDQQDIGAIVHGNSFLGAWVE
jgi:hypothetical protein